MSKYQISEQTQQNLIDAAGSLFAEKGIEGVTTREIARKAGAVQNAITYHFGGIEGLIDAVWTYVLIQWEPGGFIEFIKSHQTMNTLQEKREIVQGGIHCLFNIMYQPDRPLWISKFLIRSAMTPSGKKYVARTISRYIAPELIKLYLKITGNKDEDAARCWSLRILAAPMVFTANLSEFTQFRHGEKVNSNLYRKLEEITIREALFAVGLNNK